MACGIQDEGAPPCCSGSGFPVPAAGGGQLSCNSRTGQIKNPPSECSAAATMVDIPSRWDLQQRRPRPVADAGRSCWGSGQQDASAAQGTRGCWEPQPGALNNSPTGALVAVLRTAALSRVVVPSVCFTPWSGVRIPLTTAPASLPCSRRWRRSAQLQFPCGSN